MKLKDYTYLLLGLLIAFCILSSCGGGNDTPNESPELPIEQIKNPGIATLVFPEDNTECNTGEIINENKSNVTFTWTTSENTTNYEVNLKNLHNNNTIKQTTDINEATIAIERGTPYEWYVISSNVGNSTIGTSAIWKFYNEGQGVTNYAPFPAQAISPKRGENIDANDNKVNLEWISSDVDNDIVQYEILFDNSDNPTTSIGTTSDNIISAVSVNSNTVYKWKVITLDSQNNRSTSEIFEFKTN